MAGSCATAKQGDLWAQGVLIEATTPSLIERGIDTVHVGAFKPLVIIRDK